MTADEFNAAVSRIGPSRRAFCKRIGMARSTADRYAQGTKAVPMMVALAIAALDAGLPPAGSPEKSE